MGFLKLDDSILTSTLWLDRSGRDLLIAAGLKARPRLFSEPVPVYPVSSTDGPIYTLPPGWYGFTDCSGPGLVALTGHNPADPADWGEGMAALRRLTEPDPDSRDPSYEGRRLARVAGGYIVLSLMKYRDKDTTAAERKRRERSRKRENVTSRRDTVTCHIGQRAEGRGQRTERDGRSGVGGGELEGDPPARPGLDGENGDGHDRQEREDLAARLWHEAVVLAGPLGLDPAALIAAASRIEASNGRPEASFRDPRAPGISPAWLAASLRALPGAAAALSRPVPL